tara:strand:+ start:977 stop:2143 length:1167 start_codon:yes stop_codon:yes gene_type:complete
MFEYTPTDWDVRRFGDFATLSSQRFSKKINAPVLSMTKYDGFVKSSEYFKKQIFSDDISNYKLVKNGEFAYATIHLDEGSIGLLKEFQNGYISPMYTVFKIDSSVNRDYLLVLMKTQLYLYKYSAIAEGTVDRRKAVKFLDLKNLNIPLPKIDEQEKIAYILSSVDNLIQNTDKLIEKTTRLKKGLVQELFTRGIDHTKFKKVPWYFGKEIEIPEEWEVVKFRSMIKMVYGSGLTEEKRDNIGNPVYGSGGVIGLHSKPIVNGPGIVVARKGSLGNVFFEKDDFFPIDTVYYITEKQTEIDLKFLFYYLLFMKLENLRIVTSKPGISREDVYSYRILSIPFEEQQKIASILSNTDEKIQSYEQYKEKLQRLKKSLIQKLLTGEVRVAV